VLLKPLCNGWQPTLIQRQNETWSNVLPTLLAQRQGSCHPLANPKPPYYPLSVNYISTYLRCNTVEYNVHVHCSTQLLVVDIDPTSEWNMEQYFANNVGPTSGRVVAISQPKPTLLTTHYQLCQLNRHLPLYIHCNIVVNWLDLTPRFGQECSNFITWSIQRNSEFYSSEGCWAGIMLFGTFNNTFVSISCLYCGNYLEEKYKNIINTKILYTRCYFWASTSVLLMRRFV